MTSRTLERRSFLQGSLAVAFNSMSRNAKARFDPDHVLTPSQGSF